MGQKITSGFVRCYSLFCCRLRIIILSEIKTWRHSIMGVATKISKDNLANISVNCYCKIIEAKECRVVHAPRAGIA